MGAAHSERCDRIDGRFRRAHELIEQWVNGNREHVFKELGLTNGARAGKAVARMVAAIGWTAATGTLGHARVIAVGEMLEAIARERDR